MLEPVPQSLGDADGVTATVRSAMFDYGLSRRLGARTRCGCEREPAHKPVPASRQRAGSTAPGPGGAGLGSGVPDRWPRRSWNRRQIA